MVQRIPLTYMLVQDSESSSRSTIFHLLNEGDVGLLRCFMALSLLPTDTGDLVADQPPFVAALKRVHTLPIFRKAERRKEPPSPIWKDMTSVPLLMLMAGDTSPDWLDELTAQRHVGMLSSSPRVIESVRANPHLHTGLLKGFDDLREAYRVIRELLAAAADDECYGALGHYACTALAATDLFANRPRLDFIPPIPLPQPDKGRPAAYLINRMSNNVEEPTLLAESPKSGLSVLPQMLNWIMHACTALAAIELGAELPTEVSVERDSLTATHSLLTGAAVNSEGKFDALLELGRSLGGRRLAQEPARHNTGAAP
jgi:hypothetical protein